MQGRPQSSEAAAYFFTYINEVASDDALVAMEQQLDEALVFLSTITEEKSLFRYAPGKWSIRQVLNHITDTERAFAFRALWFARGFDVPLPSFDQDVAAAGAEADTVTWAAHVEEFRRVRLATIGLFASMPAAAWMQTGIAGGNPFSVRALAFIIAGHVAYHVKILRERYL
jgi:DinB family protein